MNAPRLSRRAFVVAGLSAAGGLLVSVSMRQTAAAMPLGPTPWPEEAARAPGEIDAFVVVNPDDTIVLRIAKSEMGQGVMTSLAMIVAEELECDFAKVSVEYALSSSQSRRQECLWPDGDRRLVLGPALAPDAAAGRRQRARPADPRRGGALGRRTRGLRRPRRPGAAGSVQPFGALWRTRRGGRRAAGAGGGAGDQDVPDQFKLIGGRLARLDTPLKINGSAKFGIDIRLDGMVYAAVANCPVFGGKVKSYDEAALKNRRGIIAVVPVQNGIAVVADRFWRAKEAVAALPVVWDEGPAASTDSAQFRAEYRAALDGPMAMVNRGDIGFGSRRRETGRGGLRRAASRPCGDGASQRHGALAAGQDRRLDGHPGAGNGARPRRKGRRRRG